MSLAFHVAAIGADRWSRRGDKDSLWRALLAAAVGALMLAPRTPWLLLATMLALAVLLVPVALLLHRTPKSRS
jgi:hypothetical protein